MLLSENAAKYSGDFASEAEEAPKAGAAEPAAEAPEDEPAEAAPEAPAADEPSPYAPKPDDL